MAVSRTYAQIISVLTMVYIILSCGNGSPITASVPISSSQQSTNVPQYRFQYYLQDITKSHDENGNGEAVHGTYTVADPNGDLHRVTYTADVGNGFQAVINMQPGGSPLIKTEHIHMSLPQQQPAKRKSQHLFNTQEQYSDVSYGTPMVKTQEYEYGGGTTISMPASVILPQNVQDSSHLSNRTDIKFEVKLANASDLPFNYNMHDGMENKQVKQVQQVTSDSALKSLNPQIFPTRQEESERMNYGSKIRTSQHSFRQSNMSTHIQANYEDRSLKEEKDNNTTEGQLLESSPSNEKMFELLSQKMTSSMTEPFNDKNFQHEHTESLHTNLTNKETETFHDRPHLIRMVHKDSKRMEKELQGNTNDTHDRSQNITKTKENNEQSLRSLLMDPDSLKAIGIDLETIEFGQGSLPMIEKIASSNSHLKFVQSAPQHTTHIISHSDVYGMLRNYPRSLKRMSDSQTTSRGSTADSTASIDVPTNAHISMSPLTTILVQDTFKAQLNTTPLTLHRAPVSPTRQGTDQQGKSLVSTDTSLVQLPSKSGSSTIQQYPMKLFLHFPLHHSTIPHPKPHFHQRTSYFPSVAFVRVIVMPVTNIKDGKL